MVKMYKKHILYIVKTDKIPIIVDKKKTCVKLYLRNVKKQMKTDKKEDIKWLEKNSIYAGYCR